MGTGTFFDLITEGISIPLTKLASGYKPQGLIADQVFPVVGHPIGMGQIPIFGKDAFNVYETRRARLAKSNRATISPDSWIDFACVEHDLAIPMDSQELQKLKNIPGDRQLKALFDLENRTRRRVQWNMALGKEGALSEIAQATESYPSGHFVILSNGDCWSETGSTPIQDIETGREAIRAALGVYPNTMFMGASSYATLKFHPQYQALMNANKDKIVTTDLIAMTHDLKKVVIGLSMGKGIDGAFYDLWGDNVLLAYIPDTTTPDVDEPSFGYTITPSFSDTPYPYVDIFEEEGGKIVNVRCTDNYTQVFTMPMAGYLIKNTKK
ncbi:MAG: hypothetical protein CSYNP_01591 [Syntrophus sp. SKADARSKE-3]|nr:hypothetical protein [Syntrophus sp. SKADARSKE-3]